MKKLIFLFFLVISEFIYAQDFSQQIDLLAQKHHDSYPDVGLVLSVSDQEKILFEHAYGYSNLSFSIKTHPRHKFRIGSVTKQFTAVAILKLTEQDKISLTDPIQNYLPGFPSGVTIEHLLTHTSGLMDYSEKPDWLPKVSKQDLEPKAIAEYIQNDSLKFIPGSRVEYSNIGYHLLGLIIERISGKTYADYLEEEIFNPLQMSDSFAHSSTEVKAGMAEGYEFRKGIAYVPEFIHPKQPFSAGNVVSTTADLRKWYNGLFSGKLIELSTLQKALTPYTLNDSTQTAYGYGWELDTLEGLQVISHGSYYPGYMAEVLYFPETEILVTALSNSMPLTNMVKKTGLIANSKPLENKEFLQLTAGEMLSFNATYQKGNDQWIFEVIDDRLYYSRNNSSWYEIKPIRKDFFYSLDWDVYLEFRDFENHNYGTFVLHWNGTESEYPLLSKDTTGKK